MSIPGRLQPYVFATLACLLVAAIGAYDLVREHGRSLAEAGSQTANLAGLLTAHASQSLRRVETKLDQGIGSSRSLGMAGLGSADSQARAAARRALQADLDRLMPLDGLVSALVWASPDGQSVVAASAGYTPDLGEPMWRDWFERAQAVAPGALVIGRPWKLSGGEWRLPVGRRTASAGRQEPIALVALVNIGTWQPVFDTVDTGRNGFVTLFLDDAWIVATSPANEALLSRNWSTTPLFAEHLKRSGNGTVGQVVVRDNTERVYSYRTVADYPLIVSVGLSLTDSLAEWRARVAWSGLLLALVTAGGFWGAAMLSRNYVLRGSAEREAAESARHIQAVIDHAADAILTVEQHGRITSANPVCAEMFGYPVDDLVGKPVSMLVEGLYWAPVGSPAWKFAATSRERVDGRGQRRDGSCFACEIAVTQASRDGRPIQIALIRDVTDRERAQAAIADARDAALRGEQFLRALTDHLPLRISYVDRDLRYRFVNLAQCERFGLSREAIVGRTRVELTGQALPEDVKQHIDAVLAGEPQRFETAEVDARGQRVIESFIVPDRAVDGRIVGFYSASSDATERHQQRQQIERSLAERETLLREVYHRVKNNLQVIQSLLNLQRRGLPEGTARAALNDSVQRVHAMALVHEKLYQTGGLDAVSVRDYTTELLRYLGEVAGSGRRGIELTTDIDPVVASLEVSVPFGLLVTELVGNSLKHGYPKGRRGTVQVQLRQQGDGLWLRVRDDGIGLPVGFDLDQASSMGLQLAASLAGQLGGCLQAERADSADPNRSAGTSFAARVDLGGRIDGLRPAPPEPTPAEPLGSTMDAVLASEVLG